jgi:hypothetical protein
MSQKTLRNLMKALTVIKPVEARKSIGKTQSGKDIFDVFPHDSYKNFNSQDHSDAMKVHQALGDKAKAVGDNEQDYIQRSDPANWRRRTLKSNFNHKKAKHYHGLAAKHQEAAGVTKSEDLSQKIDEALQKGLSAVSPAIALHNWKYKPDPKRNMAHFEHSGHGTITIKPNDRTAESTKYPFIAVHNGAPIGRYQDTTSATMGVANYVRTLAHGETRMHNVPSAGVMGTGQAPTGGFKPTKKSEDLRSSLEEAMTLEKAAKPKKQAAPKKPRSLKVAAPKVPNKLTQNVKLNSPVQKELLKRYRPLKKLANEVLTSANPEQHPAFADLRKQGYIYKDKHEEKMRINHFQMVGNISDDMYRENPDQFKPVLTMANGKTARHGVATFDMLPRKTCPAAGVCQHTCYVDSAVRIEPKLANMAINTQASKHANFVPEMNGLLASLKNHKKDGLDWSKNFRIHASGDFYTPEYCNKWDQIIADNPQTKFGAYTKSYADPSMRPILFSMFDRHPNFTMRQSVGSKHNHMIDPAKPMAVVCEADKDQVENGVKAGLVFCGHRSNKGEKANPLDEITNDDRQAYDRNNHIILIKDHYQKKGVHDFIEHIKGLPPELHSLLLNAILGGRIPVKKSEITPGVRFDITDHYSQPDEAEQVETELHNKFRKHLRSHKLPNLK